MIEVEIDKSVYLPCFHHLLEPNDIDIELIWGGRDSGKSKFVSQLLTDEAMSEDYFRCLLIKETHESIKDAQWQMICDTAEQWEVDGLFKFRTSPLSITCINGSTFATRGMDKPGKIRSFSNPSHAWIEEANQISEDAFITLLTGLRSDYGRVKLWMTFNPESNTSDFIDFWIYRMFFKDAPGDGMNFTNELVMKFYQQGKEVEVRLKYRSTHVTKDHNPYVTAQRHAIHESLAQSNPYWYRVFTLGLWGNPINDSPWLFAFSRGKHVSSVELFAKRSEILYLSWDFNRNPTVCTLIQWYNETVFIIEVFKVPNIGTEGICDLVMQKYKGFLIVVTGDYSGDTPSSLYKEQVTNYTLIKTKFRLNEGQIKISPNPKLNKNQTLVNAIHLKYKVLYCPVKAKPAIFDAENVKMRADGTIVKDDRNDPSQQADVLDTLRYWFNQFMAWYIKT